MIDTHQANYFHAMNKTLKSYERAIPFLFIDLDIIDKNIQTLKTNLNQNAAFRIVVKSLPCPSLIHYVMKQMATKKLMVFHQPFLTELCSELDEGADVLLGKPMPIKTASYFYNNLPENKNGFNPYTQIQWLVDSKKRIQEYVALAKNLGHKLRLNMEIDVGLHRGGFADVKTLQEGLQLINQEREHVSCSGLMGYDPHVVKLPKWLRSPEKALRLSNQFYETCKETIRIDFPNLWNDDLTFNGSGSPTVRLHKTNSPLNDIAAGSCLVKPTTFDLSTLNDFQAAAFIATPVLKSFTGTTLPAMERWKKLLNVVSASNRQSFFIYGGFWKADYVFPQGTKQNSLFGASTNQTMINAPNSVDLKVDDFVFLRPHQSEFVFLQFGNILTVRNKQIESEWRIFNNE